MKIDRNKTMADKETIKYFKRFSDSTTKEDDVNFAKVLSAKLNWSRPQRQMFNGLLSNLSDPKLENEQYINIKQEMITMIQKNLESTINNESIVKKLSLGRKIANLAGIGVLAAGLYGATPAYGQDSGVTNTSGVSTTQTEERDLNFYEIQAKEMERLNYQEKPKKVIEDFERYLNEPNNQSVLYYNELGRAYKKRGNFIRAEKLLLKGLEMKNENIEITQFLHNNLGEVYYRTGRREEAIKQFKITIDLNSTNERANVAKTWLDNI